MFQQRGAARLVRSPSRVNRQMRNGRRTVHVPRDEVLEWGENGQYNAATDDVVRASSRQTRR